MPFSRRHRSRECILLPALHETQAERYRNFRTCLDLHSRIQVQMAELEAMYHAGRPFCLSTVEKKGEALFETLAAMVQGVRALSEGRADLSLAPQESLRRAAREALTPVTGRGVEALVLPMEGITQEEERAAGGKAAHLAQALRHASLRIPEGFVLTTKAYLLFLKESGLDREIAERMAAMDADSPLSMEETGRWIRHRILETPLPHTVRAALEDAVAHKASEPGSKRFAARSSAIGEDGEASFAGQYLSVLHVAPENLPDACRRVMASVFTSAAMAYRMARGIDYRETPMAVLVLEMVEARLSGVLYTGDPLDEGEGRMRVSALAGPGENLVSGMASPGFSWFLDKEIFQASGEGAQEETPLLRNLWEMGRTLEGIFRRMLDVEWAVDKQGRLFLLQVRPLHRSAGPRDTKGRGEKLDAPLRVEGGRCAAAGLAAGKVWILKDPEAVTQTPDFSEDTILVIPWASTSVTPWVRKVRGIIAEKGDMACHLASVAREFGVPALFDVDGATRVLAQDEAVTLWAGGRKIYAGIVEEAVSGAASLRTPFFATPVGLRMRLFLDVVTPLTLTEDRLKPEECRTVHDVVRVCHAFCMQEMLRFGDSSEASANAVRLELRLPFSLLAVDLGGGLRYGLTSCDAVDIYDVTSPPFRALRRGLFHPGILWEKQEAGSQDADRGFFRDAFEDRQGYVFVSKDYLNLRLDLLDLFVILDALASDAAEHNYIHLQLSRGAGPYFGRSIRIRYMAQVLDLLGFETQVQGAFAEAWLPGRDAEAMHAVLEQLGRLLGASMRLRGVLEDPEKIPELADAFLKGRYEVLWPPRRDVPEGFYRITGNWTTEKEGVLQDGASFGSSLSAGVSQTMGRLLGRRYQDFLDVIGAYAYFPLLVARKSRIRKGRAAVTIKLIGGRIEQAGGLAFGIRDADNYFVFRISVLDGTASLFEFRNGRRAERGRLETSILCDQWRRLEIHMTERGITGFLDEARILEWEADRELVGYIGLWTKADSRTLFSGLTWSET